MSRYAEYMQFVERRRAEHPEWREGQTYFNVLYYDGFDPEFANSIRGSDLDPFHRDIVISSFLDAVIDRWELL